MRPATALLPRLAVVLALLSAAASSFAQSPPGQAVSPQAVEEARTVTGAEAVESARELDGSTVAFQGELIGEAMRRGEHAWLNLADLTGTLGAWVALDDLPEGLAGGGWKARGDTLLVTGILHRACAGHGGDLDLHAATVEVVLRGRAVGHPVEPWKPPLAAGLALLSGLLALAARSRSRRRTGQAGARQGRRTGL